MKAITQWDEVSIDKLALKIVHLIESEPITFTAALKAVRRAENMVANEPMPFKEKE